MIKQFLFQHSVQPLHWNICIELLHLPLFTTLKHLWSVHPTFSKLMFVSVIVFGKRLRVRVFMMFCCCINILTDSLVDSWWNQLLLWYLFFSWRLLHQWWQKRFHKHSWCCYNNTTITNTIFMIFNALPHRPEEEELGTLPVLIICIYAGYYNW